MFEARVGKRVYALNASMLEARGEGKRIYA